MLIWASAKVRLNSIGGQLHLCAWKMCIDYGAMVANMLLSCSHLARLEIGKQFQTYTWRHDVRPVTLTYGIGS